MFNSGYDYIVIRDKIPLHIRVWTCKNCNSVLDRDINASINIRNFALADALGHSVVLRVPAF